MIVEPVRAIAKNLKQRTHLRHGALSFETAQEPLPKAAVRQVDASRLSTPAGTVGPNRVRRILRREDEDGLLEWPVACVGHGNRQFLRLNRQLNICRVHRPVRERTHLYVERDGVVGLREVARDVDSSEAVG